MNAESNDANRILVLIDERSVAHTELVSLLLDKGLPVDATNSEDWTLMHLAADKGHTDVVELLLARGADVNSLTKNNSSCLLKAVTGGHSDVVGVLVSAGADVNLRNTDGVSLLHTASSRGYVDIVNKLLDGDAEVDIRDDSGQTPLYVAAAKGHADVVKTLLHNGADVNSVTNAKAASLSIAACHERTGVIRVLLSAGADVNTQCNDGFSPLHVASKKGGIDAVNILLENGALIDIRTVYGMTPLHLAATEGKTDTVKLLLDKGADMNSVTNNNVSPLLMATLSGHTEVVRTLVTAGADVNTCIRRSHDATSVCAASAERYHDDAKLYPDKPETRNEGDDIDRPINALSAACACGFHDIMGILLDGGADTSFFKTIPNGHKNMVEWLIEYDVNKPDEEGFTALMALCFYGQCDTVQLMLDDGVEINSTDCYGLTALHFAAEEGHSNVVELLLSRGANVNAVTHKNESCLLMATCNGHAEVVRLLMSAGAEVNVQRRKDDFSVLHVASCRGYIDIVNLLLDNGAEIEIRDESGCTPLFYAAFVGESKVADALISRGANVDAISDSGFSPLQAAITNGHKDAAVKLLQHNADIMCVAAIGISEYPIRAWVTRILKGHGEELLNFMWHLRKPEPHKQAFMLEWLAFWNGAIHERLSLTRDRYNEHTRLENDDSLHALTSKMFEDDCQSMRQFCSDFVSLIVACTKSMINVKDDTNFDKLCFNELHDIISESNIVSYSGSEVFVRMISYLTNYFKLSHRLNNEYYSPTAADGCLDFRCNKATHFTTDLEAMISLLENGADIEAENVDGLRPIHCAVRMRNVELVGLLIKYGANVDAADVLGNRPLHEAVCIGLGVVQLLVQRGAILNVQNNNGKTPLHIAIERQQADVIMFLLSQDADVGITDVWRNTPLHYVTCELKLDGFAEYLKQVRDDDLVIRNIVGVSAKQQNIAHGLLDYQHDDKEYLDHNKHMYADCQGNTPLHYAVGVYAKLGMYKISDNVSNVVEFLVKHGADIYAQSQNYAGFTPLHVARGLQATKLCLQYADDRSFTIKDKQGRNFWHLLFLLRTEDDLEMSADIIWPTIAISDAEYMCDNLCRTPLHYVCMRLAWSTYTYGRKFINRFNNKYINHQDKFGRTALHYAAIVGNQKLMDFLETKKADATIQDVFEKTAMQYVNMRSTAPTKSSILQLTASSSCIANNLGFILVCVKQCFEHGNNDSTEHKTDLHKIIRDSRGSDDATSYVRNIYLGCRIDYHDDFGSKTVSLRGHLCESENMATTATQSATIVAAIQDRLQKTMEHLAKEISSQDDRFACQVVPVGSAHEGTKVGCCDEFDYNFVLTKLGEKCRVGYSPESPPGFVLLEASTSDYDEDLFDSNKTLDTRIVKFRFDSLIKHVLSSSQFCETTGFEFIDPDLECGLLCENVYAKPRSHIKLAFIQSVNGYHVLHQVSVDIVPVLQIKDWWPEDARRQDLCQAGECLIVFTQPQNKYPWIGWTEPHGFISFARAESRLLRESPQVVKAAYMVVKRMSHYFCHYTFFSSHVIKTALLWCLDENGFSSCSQSNDSDEINWDEMLRLVQMILRRLLCFAAQDYVPCFFMPKCHQPVWLAEKHLKQFHMRLYQQELTYNDLFSLNDQQSLDEILHVIKILFIFSHVMYWTVLPDTDERKLFVPHTINPLREISYDLHA